MEEGFLPFAGPRKLSVQEKNVLKIRSLEKEKKDSLEVKSCELTQSCLGVGCVITCPAFRVCYTLPKTIPQTHLICCRKLCPTSQPSPATAAPKLRSLPLAPWPSSSQIQTSLTPPGSVGLWAAPFEQKNGESESRTVGNQPSPPGFLSRQTPFGCWQAGSK